MSKLIFIFGVMNVGKTTDLVATYKNYSNANKKVKIIKPDEDTRTVEAASRDGSRVEAHRFSKTQNLSDICAGCDVVLVDEAQFLSEKQVLQLRNFCTDTGARVICYGLKVNFKGKLFEGSKALLEVSEKLIEKSGVCHCGKKATMILKTDESGAVVKDGVEIEVGYEDKYTSVCYKHWRDAK